MKVLSSFFATAIAAVSLFAAHAGASAEHDQGRRDRRVLRSVRRLRRADRGRHEGVHEAAWRHGRRQEDRADHARHEGAGARSGEALRAGADHARQGAVPRRLRAHAQCDGGRTGRDRGEGADDHLQRGDVVDHDQVAVRHARVDDDPAGQRADGASGRSKNGIKQVYTVVADYGPGIDAETQFTKTFKAGGGEIVGTLRTPLQNPDFSAAIQRVKDAKPQAVFVFLPAGEQGIAFVKGFNERGLAAAGIKLIATGDITDDHVLAAMGDPTLGHDHVVPLFGCARFARERGVPEGLRRRRTIRSSAAPNFMAAAGYDTMAVIYEVAKKLGGNIDGDKAMAAIKGMKWTSPRGPVVIDAETRDITQTVYIRKVEKKNGKLANVEFDKIADVKDPGK